MKTILKLALIFHMGILVSGCYIYVKEKPPAPPKLSLKSQLDLPEGFEDMYYLPSDSAMQNDSLKYLFQSWWVTSRNGAEITYKEPFLRCGTPPTPPITTFDKDGKFSIYYTTEHNEYIHKEGYFGFHKMDKKILALVNRQTDEAELYILVELKEGLLKLAKL